MPVRQQARRQALELRTADGRSLKSLLATGRAPHTRHGGGFAALWEVYSRENEGGEVLARQAFESYVPPDMPGGVLKGLGI
jgi:23S rRNA A2030 N6-methylase RlmJ